MRHSLNFDQECREFGSAKMQESDSVENEVDVIDKEVVIVGNGPSGICLSYMLAGNWPYYTGEPHPGDEMLTARLRYNMGIITNDHYRNDSLDDDGDIANKADSCQSGQKEKGTGLAHCTRWDLETLSLGLEGRNGGRPLGLLMDQLQHPCVDAGLDLPSLLTWRSAEDHRDHKIIDHVVLGKGPPGGAWQSMDPNILTISLSRWMSLPGLDLRQWELLVEAEHLQKLAVSTDRMQQEKMTSCRGASRVSVGMVAAYYKDYVHRQGLDKYFRCRTTVTSVRPITGLKNNEDGFGWMVEGMENENGRRFRYRCRRVVLATGITDMFNRLGLPDEESQSNWLTHNLNDLETRLDCIVNQQKKRSLMGDSDNSLEGLVDPVLVVGAGLSAADAIMAARFRGIPVLHAFRNSSGDWSKETVDNENGIKLASSNYDRLQWLPASIYPEYHKVYEMMADGGTNYPLYRALTGYTVVDFGLRSNDIKERRITLCAPNGQLESFRVSVAAIFIGTKPDLSYLENGGVGLGKTLTKPIDNRSNPIEIDNFTYEVVRAPRKGLYALGPLVGDNFVRFILGGALGVLTDMLSTIAK